MQFGDELDKWLFSMRNALRRENCSSSLEALVMANKVHEKHEDTLQMGCQQRIQCGSREAIMEALSRLWNQWREAGTICLGSCM